MRSSVTHLLTVCLMIGLVFGASAAGWITPNKPTIEVTADHFDAIEIDITIDGLQSQEVKTNGGLFTRLSLDNDAFKGEIGSPRLPVIRRMVEVPYGAEINLVFESRNIKTVELGSSQLIPVQPPVPKLPGALEAAVFQINEALYVRNEFLSQPEVRIQDIDCMRGHRIVVLEIAPVAYNPGENLIRFATEIGIRLEMANADRELTQRMDYRYYSLPFEVYFQEHVLNYGAYRSRDYTFPPVTPIGYLILNTADFTTAIAPFVEWKTQLGYDVTIEEVPAGATTAVVKAIIQDAYDTWPNPPSYVLLNGDTNTLPAYVGEGSGSADDNEYTELEGTGYYTPDIMIGRFPIRSVSDLETILAKVMQWEQTTMPSTDYMKDSVWLASSDHASMLEATHQWCWDNHIAPYDPANVYHPVYERLGGDTVDFAFNVNEGRGIVCYSGHGYGDGSGTASVHFVHSDVSALTNVDKYGHVMVFACGTNLHDQVISFGERWLLEANKGSVSYWGTSDSSYWDEDDYEEREIYRIQHEDHYYTLSSMCMAGLIEVHMQGGASAYYFDIYNLMGDPSAILHGRIPMTPLINAPPSTTPNPQTFTVNVTDASGPVQAALVAISMDGILLGSAFTDINGDAAIYFEPTSPGTATIMVTGRNLMATAQDLLIMAAGCGYVTLDTSLANCDQSLGITLWDADLNLSPGVADTAEVQISSDSEPSPETVTLMETGPDTSEFQGSIMTSDINSGLGYLLVSDGDTITLHYHDADCEGSPADVYDYADVDCVGPVISGTAVSEVTIESARISWMTDENSTTKVFWGETTPPANELTIPGMTLDHTAVLTELEPCTEYFFYVVSMDAAGNVAMDDNGGAFYSFTTLQLMVMLEANMDSDPGWTYEGQWAWGTPLGADDDPSSGYTGSNVVGYNLAGSYANSIPVYYATTQTFDCSGASQAFLGFWRWLGVESASWDHATVEISNDGGSTWNIVWEHTGGSLQDTSWTYQEYNISDWAAGHGNVIIRWGMGPTDTSVTYCGWNLDDVMVSYTAPCNVPILVYGDHTIDDSMGNNDGQINGGEHIAMTVTLDNLGLSATGVSAMLSTTNPHVTITQNATTFPDIPQSGSGTADLAFEFDVDPAAEDGEAIPFSIAWTCTENSGSTAMTELVVAPELVITGYQIEEVSGGENDGIWEPGETVRILVTVLNDGYGTAHDISGVLSSNLPAHVTVDTNTAVWTDIAGGDTGTCLSPYFMVTASAAIPDPSTVTFTVEFTAEGYTGDGTFMMDCTSSNFARRYMWNMDTDPMWTTENQWAWGVPQGSSGDPSSGSTGTNVYGYNLAGSYTNSMPETNLTTAAINCSGLGDVELRFMRWLGVESATYDHAYVRVSNDGVNWTTIWSHTGSSFTDPAWQTMAYDISAVADDQPTVYVRWVMGVTDSSVVYCGWNIDDVEIWADSLIPTPTPPCIHHGDVNLDNQITAVDAQMAFQIALMMMTPTFEQACAADCNGDDENTAGDAQGVFIAALGMGSCVDPLPEKRAAVDLIQQYRRPELVIDADVDLIWVGNVSGRAGEPVTVGILLDNPITSVDAFTLNLGYDRTRMELEEIREGDLNPGWVDFGWNESQSGIVTVAAYGSGLSDGAEIAAGSAGTLLEVSFRLTADCADTAVTLLSIHDDLSGFAMP